MTRALTNIHKYLDQTGTIIHTEGKLLTTESTTIEFSVLHSSLIYSRNELEQVQPKPCLHLYFECIKLNKRCHTMPTCTTKVSAPSQCTELVKCFRAPYFLAVTKIVISNSECNQFK